MNRDELASFSSAALIDAIIQLTHRITCGAGALKEIA